MFVNDFFIYEINKKRIQDDVTTEQDGLYHERQCIVIHYPEEQYGEDNGPGSHCPYLVTGPITESGHASAHFGYGHFVYVGVFVPKVGFPVPPHTAENSYGNEN